MKTTLVSVAELASMSAAAVLIVDCRKELADPAKGRHDYTLGHIPGAVYADLDSELSDLSKTGLGLGRHPLPSAAAFSQTLARWGWQPGLQVVAYDAGNGAMAAARLWWLLRYAGQPAVAVLDGGYAAWLAAGQGRETAALRRTPNPVSVQFDAAQVVLDHAAVLATPAPLLVDARAAPRYRGDSEPLDPVGGHVPGALNRPFADNLAADGRFKPAAELRRDFLALIGNRPVNEVVHMCGSGVTACHNLLAMEYAGLAGSRLYAPSWSGWCSDRTRPVATGAA
ncbi:MAG: sulfurtransferase [Rhodanobacter sp.]|nr:MAG: sulfurtransferase [Rhodanobacter sp.]TAM14546.1 MAG: sulfurtransferase [Rhodanobacter sp.]TAM37337.1 MAG: sulfurtransferase [Rhodanobacter sp.]